MEDYNPWWFREPDPVYEEWASSSIRWRPSAIDKLSLQPFSLNFLIGPRQVGKTTLLKVLVYELLGTMDPRAIFYYSCDELGNYRELGEILDSYLSAKKRWGVKSSILMLDEVTFVEEWWRAVKARIDRGMFAHDVLIISGSASIELLAGKERFPGRRGLGRDVYLYPLSFHDYVRVLGGLDVEGRGLEDPDFWDNFGANIALKGRIGEFFRRYMVTGGYPVPIREFFEVGRVTYLSYRAHLDWLRTDWLRVGRDEQYMKEIISYLLESTSTPVSWHTVARSTSISSPHTARLYIKTLEDLMIAKIIYWASPHGKADYRKNKKIFFTDPFTYQVLSKYTRVKIDEARIVEATVSTHLARRYPTYYWANKTEIDILTIINNSVLSLEVKWTHHPKTGRKPIRPIILNKTSTPVFLASLKT